MVRLETACAQRGVTEDQVAAGITPLHWRITSGGDHLYAVVDDAAVADLQCRLEAQAAQAAHERELLARYGADGVAQRQREAEEVQQAAAAAARVKAERAQRISVIQTRLEALLRIVNDDSIKNNDSIIKSAAMMIQHRDTIFFLLAGAERRKQLWSFANCGRT